MTVITLRNLACQMGGVELFRDVNCSIDGHGLVAIVGPSGVGKSSLLRLLAGLDMPSAGEVLIDQRPLRDLTPHEKRVGMLFQQPVLYDHMTVRDNLQFALDAARMPATDHERAIATVANDCGISHILRRNAGELSGGERQRAAFARVLAPEPRIRLFDEPFKTAFEPSLRASLRRAISEFHDRVPGVSIIVTHDREDAFEMADSIILMLPGHGIELQALPGAYLFPMTLGSALFLCDGTVVRGWFDPEALTLRSVTGAVIQVTPPMGQLPAGIHDWLIRPDAVAVSNGKGAYVEEVLFRGATQRLRLRMLDDTSSRDTNTVLLLDVSARDELAQQGIAVRVSVSADRLLAYRTSDGKLAQ